MQNRFRWIFLGIAALVFLAILYFGGFFGSKDVIVRTNEGQATSTPSVVTKGGITATGGDFTVEEITEPAEPRVTRLMPDLKNPVKYSADLSSDAKLILADKIAQIRTELARTPSGYEGWFNLGLAYKASGDFTAAKDAWEYAAALYDKDPVVHANLGGLYGYYLKENALAEAHLLKTIEIEPMIPNWYVRLSAFYSEVAKDNDKARNILEQGLKLMPNDQSLLRAYPRSNR